MKRILGIGTASLVLASVSVLGAGPAMADTSKSTYGYYPTLEKCQQVTAGKALAHQLQGRKVTKQECYVVRPDEKYLGVVISYG
ncbi:hypothetical protein [Brevibacterium zhoupengii]|uniref:hypothetical protein n=1 Tax=Brevibacterium zhoupengii TaxID=2898795 RepID=UPI001E2C08F0|nr:hypothetical protein [Brevibacterium zhoupengii]